MKHGTGDSSSLSVFRMNLVKIFVVLVTDITELFGLLAIVGQS